VRRAAALAAAALLAGCTLTYGEVGGPVRDPDGIVVGVTRKAEVLSRLGPPRIVQRQFDGDLYTWRQTRTRERSLTLLPVYVRAFFYSDAESRRDDLSVLFDREGVVRGVGLRREIGAGAP
jgi:outer membrane protein assembly factor BamE (lipoprotein component of BamABCDE complex)